VIQLSSVTVLTTLLDAAVADAGETVRTIRVEGHLAERDLPYAGVHQLVHAARLTDVLPVPANDPLRAASALLDAVSAMAMNEREVAAGMTNADAAHRLFISERTVEFHLSSVFRKLEIQRRHELAAVLDV
jgi:DNA-binding CsgD family transcriptional regulator